MTEICNNLRWKGFYGVDWPDAQTMQLAMQQAGVPFRCLRTARNWGPDDQPCTPEFCDSERSCFEPSNLFPSEIS